MEKRKIQSFYDVVWTEYIPEYDASEKHWNLFFGKEEIAGKKVLDAGCGTGIFSLIFAKNGASKVIGIDISPGSLSTASNLKRKFSLENVEFLRQDMLKLGFKDGSFDIVWAWGTIHHTTEPFCALNEIIRVLRKGGSLLVAVYKRTRITFIHELIRKTLFRTPRFLWKPLTKILTIFLSPIVYLLKKREKSRKGEKLEELILDWYFVPLRHYFYPEEISSFLEKKGFSIEKFLPHSGRFNSTSNFIFKARKK